ncbi:hypothetical protein GCM10023211_24000 [Orbus sasakiae]|uniref:Glycoside hydrolase family 19 catalytic domain-containing protein n=1 Tax=Orbus sasakiae TaxID=1078475 RepID=A0ABP9NCW0_9GAMM
MSNLSLDGKAWFLHPVGITNFTKDYNITVSFIEKVTGKVGTWFNGKGAGKKFGNEFKLKNPNIYQLDKEFFVSLMNNSLEEYNIIGEYHKAHFLAQCFHESASFESTLEFASGNGYDPDRHPDAIKNGNTTIGDGPKYKGRGLIQLTWKNNYREYSSYKEIDFVSNPELLAQNMKYAIDVSCWFWRYRGGIYKKYNARGDINILIDNEKNNVALVTKAINGGKNGLDHRIEIFEAIKKEWGLE